MAREIIVDGQKDIREAMAASTNRPVQPPLKLRAPAHEPREVISIDSTDDEDDEPQQYHNARTSLPPSDRPAALYAPMRSVLPPPAPHRPIASTSAKPASTSNKQMSHRPVASTSTKPVSTSKPMSHRLPGGPFVAPKIRTFGPPTMSDFSGSEDEDVVELPARPPTTAFAMPEYMSDEQSKKALQELVSSVVNMDEVDVDEDMPEDLKVTLLPHQIAGVHWLKSRETGKKRGGILADDMGLGKTVQMISLILANPPERKPRTTLIVVPLAVAEQWRLEIEDKTATDALSVLVHHGPKRTKDPKRLMRYDVVITTYETCASEHVNDKVVDDDDSPAKSEKASKPEKEEGKRTRKPREEGPLFKAEFYRVVLDEAHVIKNRNAQKSKACCDIDAKFRWALTGTPIQNSIEDLFSLFKFLGDIVKPMNDLSEFKAKIAQPLKAGRGPIAMRRLKVILEAIMLRRSKTDTINGEPLLKLPERRIHLVRVPFSDPDELAFYTSIKDKAQLELNKFVRQGSVMQNYIQVLLLPCGHPSLVTKDFEAASDSLDRDAITAKRADESSQGDDVDDLISGLAGLGGLSGGRKICTMCDEPVSGKGEHCETCADRLASFQGMVTSTKITQLLKVLEDNRAKDPKRKTIVFSQFTSMLDICAAFLKARGFKFVRFQGDMKVDERNEALRKIRERSSYTVLLCSLKCGSVGLNLTACSVVMHLDLWFNPAIENQANDRAYRLGQQRDVDVYKFTIADTVEDRLLEETKAALASAALDKDGTLAKNNKLSLKEIMSLFRSDSDPALNKRA